MQKITTFLWYPHHAEEAANFYTGIFKNSKILSVMPGPGGAVMGVTFQLEDQEYTAFNGRPPFAFNEAVSLFVACQDQSEVDYLWENLSAGGEKSQCGWLKDKFGLSWQIIPVAMIRMFQDPDRAKAQRAFTAMLQMTKIDLAALTHAFNNT